MYEDRPELLTPPRVAAQLRLYGGRTPDGRPLWRLIPAERKRIQAAGVMRTMPAEFAGDVPQPDRVEEGVFWIPRYKFTGWILERWFPASAWGSADFYESQRSGADGRTQMLVSAFPRAGDYFLVAGPWPTIDAAGDLKAIIREYVRQENERPVDWDAALRGELALEAAQRQQLADEYEERVAQLSRSQVSPVLGSLSLAAQRIRDQVAIEVGGPDWHLPAF